MTTTEQRVKYAIGSQVIAIAELQSQLEEAQAKIVELEAQLKVFTEQKDGG